MPKKQKLPHLLGSKWTAKQTTWGWRHFEVINRKNEGKWIFVEMKSACDSTTKFWLNANQLKDSCLWLPGWLSLNQQTEIEKNNKIPVVITVKRKQEV